MARTDPALRSRNTWDAKLRARGHRHQWRQVASWPRKRFRGSCLRCGEVIERGTGLASVGLAMRFRCRPRLRAVR